MKFKAFALFLLLGTPAAWGAKSAGVWISIPAGYERARQNVDAIDTAFLDWWQVSYGGVLVVHDAPTWVPDPAIAAYFRSHCVQTYGAVATDDSAVIADVSGPSRAAFIGNLVDAAISSGVDGIHLDLEEGGSGDRQNYSLLITLLARALHAAGKKLSVFTPGFVSDAQMNTGINDWSVLEQNADRIELGAYDLNFDDGADVPGPIQGADALPGSGNMTVRQILSYVSQARRPDKYYLGIAWYAYLWIDSGSGWAMQPGTKPYSQVAAAIAAQGGAPVWNAVAQEYSYGYSAGGSRYLYWFGERRSTAAMADLAIAYGLPGAFAFQSTAQEDEGNGTQGVWDSLRAQLGEKGCGGTPPPTPTPVTPGPTPTRTPTPKTPLPTPTRTPTRTFTPLTPQPTSGTGGTPFASGDTQLISLSPNPFSAVTRRLQVCAQVPGIRPCLLQIYDEAGELVSTDHAEGGCRMVTLPWLAPGVYLVALQSGGQRSVRKLAVLP